MPDTFQGNLTVFCSAFSHKPRIVGCRSVQRVHDEGTYLIDIETVLTTRDDLLRELLDACRDGFQAFDGLDLHGCFFRAVGLVWAMAGIGIAEGTESGKADCHGGGVEEVELGGLLSFLRYSASKAGGLEVEFGSVGKLLSLGSGEIEVVAENFAQVDAGLAQAGEGIYCFGHG